jgi:hypothetical protein
MPKAHEETHLVLPKLGIMHVLWSVISELDVQTASGGSSPCTSASSRYPRSVVGKSGVWTMVSIHRYYKQDMGDGGVTFAISLQLFPVSRICLSLCSSAAVHGVFVRLFLTLGSVAKASTSTPDACAVVVAIWSCDWARLIDLRFREFGPGVSGCWAGTNGSCPDETVADAVAAGAGWILGSSADMDGACAN